MLEIINFIKRRPKIFIELAAWKIFEGLLIILAANFFVRLVVFRSAEILAQIFLVWSLRIIISNILTKKFLRLSEEIQTAVRKKLHEEILRREISGGELLTTIFDTVQTLEEFFTKIAPNISSAVILLPMFLICAIFFDGLTAAILFVTLPIAPFLLYLIGRATAEKNSRAWTELQKLNGDFKEILSAITTLKMFDRISAAATRLRTTSEKSSAATLDVLKLAFVSSFALELITTLSIALVAVTLGLRLAAGNVDFEAALFLLLIAPEFFLPVRNLGTAFHVIISVRSAVDRLKNFLSEPPKSFGTVEKIKIPPEIFLSNVSFTYPKKKFPVLREINFKIPAGKVTAIVGESGCGKSTLIKLLAGLILPSDGEIFFGELPITKMRNESLWEKISYVPQSPHLFNATLAENFSVFGQSDEKNLSELMGALGLKNLELSSTQKLSRGQLQRLGIIRALLKGSPIILLDEPTAGLDSSSEKKVLALLKKFSPRRTIVIATHRPAVINFADCIIKIEVTQ